MKALVLAGGFPQIELIKKLKSRGITVLLADWGANPIAKEYCDRFYQKSTLDVDAIKEIAVEEKVDFIITVCTDQALLTVAKVSQELGLPCYIDYQTALNVTNKKYMKDKFVEYGIPSAKFIISNAYHPSLIEGFQFPLIVKPVDCNSSKGVVKVESAEQLKIAFEADVQLSRTRTAIVEEFIEGEELTVDAYIEEGVAKILAVSVNEKIKDEDKFVIFRQINPAPIPSRIVDKIKGIAQKIADSFHVQNAPLLVQMLLRGEDLYVIEFSARTGGGVKYILIENASGFDVIESVIDLTLGKKPRVEPRAPKYKYFINEHVYCYPGRFDRLEGFDELRAEGILVDYYPYKTKGAIFETVSNSGDRVVGFTIVGNSKEEITKKHIAVNERMKVLDDEGRDIARHDLLPVFDFERDDRG